MLKVRVPELHGFNENTSEFIDYPEFELHVEHSLVSISKWESKWKIPFLSSSHKKTPEQTLDYIKCMTMNQNIPDEVYQLLPGSVIKKIVEYIDDPMSATTFSHQNNSRSNEIVTSELIYYWMVSLNIPQEYQKWHLNRLLNLIKICSIKNSPPKKMSQSEIYANNRQLNELRKQQLKTKG